MRQFFILVPSLIPTGPSKGAVALANAIAKSRPVTLVSLKAGFGARPPLDSRVKEVSLAKERGYLRRLLVLKALLREAGGREKVAVVSFCFSGDGVNLFCRKEAVTCSSVRGNLFSNYRMDHGIVGLVAAFVHMVCLRGFDLVLAMSEAMAAQIKPYLGRRPEIVGNFVDEEFLEAFRFQGKKEGPLRFVFLASLSSRKQPLLLIEAMASLRARGKDVRLDMIGKGKLKEKSWQAVERLGLSENVAIHGQIDHPYELLAQADAMVLPSLSEGVSRASLEALHLGVPCVLRDVDGNAELIQNGVNGRLFGRNEDLADAMLAAAEESRQREGGGSLLPEAFRQENAARRTIELVESL